MKAKILFGLLIGTLALAGTAVGATYTDAASNYTEGSWTNGSTGGTGFEPWSIVADGGDGGWAGCGIWDSTGAGLSMGAAFGYVGKVGYVNIDRDFTQALNVGDSFALDFGVNWDSDIGNKGFNLFANGVEVINVNHGGFPGEITVNENPGITNYGTGTMRWTFTQVAADQISVYATGRDGTETFATTVTTANAYGYLGHVRFYSSGLDKEAPDQRQSYFDNLTLEQEGTPPPAPLGLSFTSGTWNPAATGDYEFVLAREGAVGDDIVLSSSNTNSVTVPATATFVSNSVSFNATVVSLTAGPATIVASNEATGVWTSYGVTPVEPRLTISGDAIQVSAGLKSYTLVRSASVGDTILLSSSDMGVLTVPVDLQYGAGSYTSTFPVTVIGYGSATITASNATSGAWATFDVTYQEAKLTVLGLTRSWVGGGESYRVIREGAVGDTVNLASLDAGVMASAQASVTFAEGENTAFFNASSIGEGTTVWTASNDDAASAGLSVTVEAAPSFGAYDDASLYAGGWTPTPAHASGFANWIETLSPEIANSFRGAFIGTGLIPGINVAGASFGLYANYSGAAPDPLPEVKLSRDFPAAMTTGQTFSVDVGYNWNSGTKGFKLKGDFEGVAYERFELFNSGNDTWSYKVDNGDPVVIWNGYIAGGFVGRVQATCTAPNTFTFSFLREGDAAPTLVEGVVLPGTIDQIEFYNYNGGSGDAENFTFNRMGLTGWAPEISKEIGPVSVVDGDLVFSVPAGYTFGNLYGADKVVGVAWDWILLVRGVDYTESDGVVTLLTGDVDYRMIYIGLIAE